MMLLLHNQQIVVFGIYLGLMCISKQVFAVCIYSGKNLYYLFLTQIFIYFSKPLRLLYSLIIIIYEIVNFLCSFFTLCYFFLSFYI